jgi:hypothetical protein
MQNSTNHGGKRNQAGRKAGPNGAKVPYATKLTPDVVKYLRQCDNAAETIDDTIRRSKAFREWTNLLASTKRRKITFLGVDCER